MDPFAEFDREERQIRRNPPAVLRPIGRTAEETFREFTETGAAADSWEDLRQDNAPDRGTGTGQAHRNRMLRVMARRATESRARFAPNRTWVAPTARRMPSRPVPPFRSSRAPPPPSRGAASRASPPRAPIITRSQSRPAPTAPSRPSTSTSGALSPRPSRTRHNHPLPTAGGGTLCNEPYWDTAAVQRHQAAEALRNATNQPAPFRWPGSTAPKLSNEPFWLQKTSTAPKGPAAAVSNTPISQPAQAKATSQSVGNPDPSQAKGKAAFTAATNNNIPPKTPAAKGPAIAKPKTAAPAKTATGNVSVAQSGEKVSSGPVHERSADKKITEVDRKASVASQTATASVDKGKASLQSVQVNSTAQQPVVKPNVVRLACRHCQADLQRPAPGLPPPGLSAPRTNGATANNFAGPSKHTERVSNDAGRLSLEAADRVSRLEAGLRELKVGDAPTGQRNLTHKEITAVKVRESGESMHAPPKTTTVNGSDWPEVKTPFRLRVRIRRLERTQPLTIHPGEDLRYRAESFCRVWQLDGYEERLYEALKQACKLQAEEVNKKAESELREAELMNKSGRNGRL